MNILCNFYNTLYNIIFNKTRWLDGIPVLLLRLFLAPVFVVAGLQKFEHFDQTVEWFGSGLGLPMPVALAALAGAAELGGGVLLFIGLAVRWVSIPLMCTMLVAIFTVHLPHGWFAIAPSNPATSPARAVAILHIPTAEKNLRIPMAEESLREASRTGVKLRKARQLVSQSPDAKQLTSKGPLVILQNGVEFAVTYFIMLMVLFFTGGGRFVSIDHLLATLAARMQQQRAHAASDS